jgi:hypothetical protein
MCAIAYEKLLVTATFEPRFDSGELPFFLCVPDNWVRDCTAEAVRNDRRGSVDLGLGRGFFAGESYKDVRVRHLFNNCSDFPELSINVGPLPCVKAASSPAPCI